MNNSILATYVYNAIDGCYFTVLSDNVLTPSEYATAQCIGFTMCVIDELTKTSINIENNACYM